MSVTYNEIVSRIQNNLNTLNKDMYIPRRFILSVFKSKAEFLMAQKFHDKSLFRETNLFRWIDCIDMEEIDHVRCGKIELQTCNIVMSSKCKLPKLLWTRYGSTALMVTNIDHSKEYKIISHSYYQSLKKTKNFEKFKGTFAIIYPDNKIVIPDSTVKKINVLLYTLDEKADDISNCDSNGSSSSGCQSYWEKELEISDKIAEVALQETLKEVMMRIQVPADENPNNDSNIKSREQQ